MLPIETNILTIWQSHLIVSHLRGLISTPLASVRMRRTHDQPRSCQPLRRYGHRSQTHCNQNPQSSSKECVLVPSYAFLMQPTFVTPPEPLCCLGRLFGFSCSRPLPRCRRTAWARVLLEGLCSAQTSPFPHPWSRSVFDQSVAKPSSPLPFQNQAL